MKKILFLFCAFYAQIISAQDVTDFDARLLFRFTQSELDATASVNPSQIDYLNFYVNNACFFHEVESIPEEKINDIPNILDLVSLPEGFDFDQEEVSKDNFNILMYDVDFFQNGKNTYRLGNKNLLIVLRSKKEIYEMFNQTNGH
tara:strand:+ start:241 stop:675 length:435 start_codon:yes stop_codon:yes gene_type:complete